MDRTILWRPIHPVVALVLLGTAGGAAQEPDPATGRCGMGRISHVFVDNHAVFDTEELREDTSFRWAYELANRLHMTTNRDFILDEALLGEGDCYDPVLLEETERLLRAHRFIARADVFGIRQPDESWHVVVDTKDEWTTKVEVSAGMSDGFELRGVEVTEENLLGKGLLLGAFWRQRDERRDIGARFETPRVLGTRLDARIEGGRTRSGRFFEQAFLYPFVGEVGRFAFRQLYLRRDELFPFSTGRDSPYTHALLPVDEERLEVTVAGRLGEPGNLTLFGLGISNETLEFPGFPDALEVAEQGDFGQTHPAPDSLVDRVRSQTLHTSATRVNLLFGQRNIGFVQRRGLDALRGVQDVEVGIDLGITLGRTVDAFSTGSDQPDDFFTRFRLFAGFAPPDLTVQIALGLEGRQIFSGGPTGDGWRDVLGELDALMYWQPRDLPAHTFLARLAGAGGWSLEQPFQLTLGGPAGVRGYQDDELPGARRMVLSLEDRVYLGWPFPDLADLGVTLFADVGRIWGGEVPFGATTPWRAAVGGGLRVGFPSGTRSVLRLDVAYPLESGAGFGDLMFRASLTDPLGLAGGLVDRQLERSRRITVGPDFFTTRR